MNLPRYPIYIPSKGRAKMCYTARFLIDDDVPFFLVIEEQEHESYARIYGDERLLVLPFRDKGSVIPARNWIKEHATEQGFERHWQLDDNIKQIDRLYKGKKIKTNSAAGFCSVEDFTDRYKNIAISGMNYSMFAYSGSTVVPPFFLNCRVYSCSLIFNSIPNQWRGKYNEDTDICLQVLADGWCTVLINVFLIRKIRTMQMKGGNTDEIYKGDGRLEMARSLERLWPGVVKTGRRFQRPQHVVHDAWRKFDTQLEFKDEFDPEKIKERNEYGLKLKQVAPEVRSDYLKKLLKEKDE